MNGSFLNIPGDRGRCARSRDRGCPPAGQKTRIDRLEGAEARVDDVVGRESVDDEVHRLDGEAQLVGPNRERRLVDLDDADARRRGGPRLPSGPRGRGARQRPAVRVVVVEGPVHQRVRSRQHPLHRARRERLRPPPPVDRHGTRASARADHHRLVVVAVSVRADEAAPGEAGHRLGEVRDHVSAVLLAVHQDVEAELLLGPRPRTPVAWRSSAIELGPRDGVARGLGAGPLIEIVGLREAADGGGGQDRQVQAETSGASRDSSGPPVASRVLARDRDHVLELRLRPGSRQSSSPQDGPSAHRPRSPAARGRGSGGARRAPRASCSARRRRPRTTASRRAGLRDPVRQLGP